MAKKMMLIDAANFNDLRSAKRHYSALDQNVSNVLDRQDLNDFDKLKLYQHTLSRFLINKQEVENEVSKPVNVQTTESKPKGLEETLLESFPAREREKVSGVLDDVVAYTPLRWNNKGELISEGRTVKDSDLSKLIAHEFKRTNKSQKGRDAPIGWDVYSKNRPMTLTSTPQTKRRSKRKNTKQPAWISYD